MLGPEAPRPRSRRMTPTETVEFPATPMLDMSFQLLAFFILTFQAPSGETRIDLYLPAAPAALVAATGGTARPQPGRAAADDLETDLLVRAVADELGDLATLTLEGSEVPDVDALADRLRRYGEQLPGEPLKVRLAADDRLRYEEAARVIGACSTAGVDAIRLAGAAGPGGPP